MKKIIYMSLLFMFASCDKADKNEPSTVDFNKWTLVEIQEPLISVSTRSGNTIPGKSIVTKSGNENLSEDFIDQIETEALRITHNDSEIEIPTRSKNKWYPNGRIQVYDDALNKLMPLEGVKVRARC